MNIYVGNLGNSLSEADIEQAFETFGKVDSVSIIKDKYSGDSKGFGFVEMSSNDEAQAAMEGLNGQELKGQNLIVNEAKPRTDKRRGGGGGGGGRRY